MANIIKALQMYESKSVNEASRRATDFYGDSKYGKSIDLLLKGKWDSKKVESFLEKLGGRNDVKYARIIDFISGAVGLNIRKYKNIGEQLPDLMKQLEVLYKDFLTESVNESSVEIGDIVFLPSANSAATVVDRFGRSVTVKLANGKKIKTVVDKIKLLAQDGVNEGVSSKDMQTIKSAVEAASSFMNIGAELKKTGMRYIFATSPMPIYVVQDKSGNRIAIVNKKYATKPDFVHGDTAVGVMESILKKKEIVEGNAFTGALFKAREEGLTEFEFNGKMYPVKKLEEKEETLSESKLTKDSLKQIIKEEYHNVKTFMEEKYGFTPELGKVYSNLADKPFLKEEEEEVIEEYDVENYEDLKEFVQFMAEYKSDINEAEYQGRKVKLGKIMQGDVKKFKVYVKNDKGNVVKVNFGQGGDAKGGTMRIRKDNPEARKSFRARHNCDNPGPRWKARYWSCRKW